MDGSKDYWEKCVSPTLQNQCALSPFGDGKYFFIIDKDDKENRWLCIFESKKPINKIHKNSCLKLKGNMIYTHYRLPLEKAKERFILEVQYEKI